MGDPTRQPITRPRAEAAEQLAAALAICARARGKDDARLLLTACGLLAPGAIPPRPRLERIPDWKQRRPRCRACGYVKTRCQCGGM